MDFRRSVINNCSIKQLLVICLLCGTVFITAYHVKCRDINIHTTTTLSETSGKESFDGRSVHRSYTPYVQNCSTGNDRERDVNERKRFPNSIIIGVKKGGTRALLNMLEAHPDIVSAHRELHYFDYEVNFKRGVEYYIDQMPISRPGQITIEKSPHYFVTDYVPQRMYMVSPNLKLILIIRDPVSRLISDYTQLDTKKVVKNVANRPSFEQAVMLSNGSVNRDYVPVQVGEYGKHIKNWLKYFPLEQLLIVDGGRFISNPFEELQKVEEYLELNPYFQKSQFYFSEEKGFYCWKTRRKSEPQCLGDKKGRSHPAVPDDAIQKLKEYYRSSNEEFYQLAQKNFNW